MARLASVEKLGFYEFPEELHEYVIRMFKPSVSKQRAFDISAGRGIVIQHIGEALNLQPYAVELEYNRYQTCLERLGAEYTINDDTFNADVSHNAFALVWDNPPYGDKAARNIKMRQELEFVDYSWDWVAPGGYHVVVVYNQHLTEAFALNLGKNADRVDLYRAWDERLGYDFVVAVCRKRLTANAEEGRQLAQDILTNKRKGILDLRESPIGIYEFPQTSPVKEFRFRTRDVNPEQVLQLVKAHGADRTARFQVRNTPPMVKREMSPVAPPKEGHMLPMIMGGGFDSLRLDAGGHDAMLRSAIRRVAVKASETLNVDAETGAVSAIITNQISNMPVTSLLHEMSGMVEIFNNGDGYSKFLKEYYPQLIAQSETLFPPAYNVSTPYDQEPNKQKYMKHVLKQRVGNRFPLLPAQAHASTAMATVLWSKRPYKGVMLLAATGSGKTAMINATLDASQREGKIKPGQVTLVTCPGHLVKKWEREALTQLRDRRVWVITRTGSNRKTYDTLYQIGEAFREAAQISAENLATTGRDDTVKIIIINQDLAKRGEGWELAATRREVWQKNGKTVDTLMPKDSALAHKKRMWLDAHGYKPEHTYFACPVTGTMYVDKVTDKEGNTTIIPIPVEGLNAKRRSFKVNEKNGNGSNRLYHSIAWQEVRRVNLKAATTPHYTGTWIDGRGITMPFNAIVPIWRYIKSQWSDKLAIMVADEGHESAGGKERTDRQDSFEHLADIAGRIIFATATVMNGYSSRMYSGCTKINPSLYQRYPNNHVGRQAWVHDMGVIEEVLEERDSKSSGVNSGVSRKRLDVKEAPGISVGMITEILPYSIILELRDLEAPELEKIMVKKTEHGIAVRMDSEMEDVYDEAYRELFEYAQRRATEEKDKTFYLTAYNSLMRWLDNPHIAMPVTHKWTERDQYGRITNYFEEYVTTIPAMPEDYIPPKEAMLKELTREQIERRRGVGVFVREVGVRDVRPRLQDAVQSATPLVNSFILSANSIEPERREELIDGKFKNGMNVLITNGALVKTGLDLLPLQRLICYSPEPQLDTLEQMMGRAWRLPQRVECENYYLYYDNTVQEQLSELIHAKRLALKAVQGDIAGLFSLVGMGNIMDELIAGKEAGISIEEAFRQMNKREIVSTEWNYVDRVNFDTSPYPMAQLANAEKVAAAVPTNTGGEVAKIVAPKEGKAQYSMF